MENYVKFLRGTPTAFARLVNKDPNTLYFISENGADTGSLYLGNKLIIGSIIEEVKTLTDLNDILIDRAGLLDGDVLAYDWAQQKWINKTLTEVIVEQMQGATTEMDGNGGIVPTPLAGDENKFLRGDGTWATPINNELLDDFNNVKTDFEDLVQNVRNNDGSIKPIEDIVNDILISQLIPENAQESLDTLQEIAQWIQDHPNDAAQLNQKILELQQSSAQLSNQIQEINNNLQWYNIGE